jgi:riboflavin biosynthesis pyrimidine reductase
VVVRILIDRLSDTAPGTEVADELLGRLYEPPRSPWLRVNMVATTDGAATGANGRTGSINNVADKRVFDLLRSAADAVVVGAGTARVERYRPAPVPLVVLSRRGSVPELLRDAAPGQVLLATRAAAPGLAESRELLGHDHVLVTGDEEVDLAGLQAALADRGLVNLLSEGGPSLLSDLLEAGVVDELCLTSVPLLVGGPNPRITAGGDLDVPLELAVLLEQDGTLLGRWLVTGRRVGRIDARVTDTR